ncbi:transcription termination/antitermination NusG family protein [Bacillus thuringiensis]|uniref:transcription termination/antitermination NusG family protein n=1 Tax=Bacillus thuringiensis TaxID=1428 RepID=UPI0021D669B8|nr:transcription termination/antitermination NusG family protein [Bacillus thuringiensis]MCU7666916.1 hypothetical protein [Bacillus thuringiensis]
MEEQLPLKWYVIVVNPGQELSVREKLSGLMKNKQFEDYIKDVRIISETVESKTGKQLEKVPDYKGYVFVKMIHTNETYNAVKLQVVRHILGGPTPIRDDEAKRLFGEEA